MRIAFSKYHGTGNDFIIMDGRKLDHTPHATVIAGLCDRHFGIGADGLIIVSPGSQGVDYAMLYFNADGRESSMCGNGARCAFAFARRFDLAPAEASFRAYDGVHLAMLTADDQIAVTMRDVYDIERRDDNVFVLDTGSPHYVEFVNDVQAVDVFHAGREIRNSPAFLAQGINVNFAAPGSGDGSVRVRTYERGVEDITLSCGTGVTAVALAYAVRERLDHGPVVLETDGGRLSVDFRADRGKYAAIRLVGPAAHVFDGVIDLS